MAIGIDEQMHHCRFVCTICGSTSVPLRSTILEYNIKEIGNSALLICTKCNQRTMHVIVSVRKAMELELWRLG